MLICKVIFLVDWWMFQGSGASMGGSQVYKVLQNAQVGRWVERLNCAKSEIRYEDINWSSEGRKATYPFLMKHYDELIH